MGLTYDTPIIVGLLTYSDPIDVETPPSPPAPAVPPTPPIIISDPTATLTLSPTPIGPTLASLTSDGILWYEEAPAQPVTPYAVLFQVSGSPTAKTTAFTVIHEVYQFSAYADTKKEARAIATIAALAYDRKTVYEDVDIVVQTQSGVVRVELAKGLGLNGADAWMGYFEITVFSQRKG